MTQTANPMKRYYLFFVGLAVVSALAIVSNLYLRRGPVHDAQAVSDIQQIQQNVDSYYLSHNTLPDALNAIGITGDTTMRLSQYQYVVTGPRTYQLCASFLTQHRSRYGSPQISQYGVETPNPDEHIKGRQCFTYTVVPIGQPYPLVK